MSLVRMIIVLVVVLMAAGMVCAAETDWATARYDESQTGYTPQQLTLPLTMCWQFNSSKFANNTSTPAVVGNTAYFASGDRVYAVDTATGVKKWQYPASDRLGFNVKTGITVWEDLLFFGGTDGNIYALTIADGRPVWRYPTSGSIRSTPVISGGTMFVGSDDNSLYAIDARSGELSWLGGFRTKDDVIASAAVAPGLVIFASMDANLYAANVSTGKMRWKTQLPISPVRSAPVISGNLVFIGSGRSILALNAKNGQVKYSIATPSDIATPLAIAGDSLYVICKDRKLYAFEVNMTGPKAKWSAAAEIGLTTIAPPTVAGNIVYVGSNRGQINAFTADTGELVWSYTITPYDEADSQSSMFTDIAAPLVVANNSLFALTDDGSLHCFTNQADDDTPPKIYNVSPKMGTAMSGQPPIIVSAILFDESSGVNPNSIQLLLDNEDVEYTYDIATLTITYETPITYPLRQLPDGRHFLTVLASDWKGNQLAYSWSFIVDNSMPPSALSKARAKEAAEEARKKAAGGGVTTPKAPSPPRSSRTPVEPRGSTPQPPGGSFNETPPTPPEPIGRDESQAHDDWIEAPVE